MSKSRILGASAVGLVAVATLGGLAIANDAARAAAEPTAGCPAAMAAMAAKDGAAQRFGAADANADGALSRDEVAGKLPAIAESFDALDLDGDGRLTSFEIHHGAGATGAHGRVPIKPAAFQTQTLRL